MPSKRTISRACERCSAPILVSPTEVKRGGGRFCSHRCANKYNQPSTHVELTCSECGVDFSVKLYKADTAKTCSYECMGAAKSRLTSIPFADRFWTKVNKNGPIPTHRPDLGPCWIWTAGFYPAGYGLFNKTRGHPTNAHIVAYELVVGPVPGGLQLDHLCRVRACVNPSHLDPVTGIENRRRGLQGILKTHCPSGHPYDTDNTLLNKKGWRTCRECSRLRCSPHLTRQRPAISQPRNK